MSLQTRLSALISAIGADIKAINDELALPLSTVARAKLGNPGSSSNGYAKVILDAETFDPGNNYNSTAVGTHPYAYTCPSTGYYQVEGGVYGNFTLASQRVVACLYRNGSMIAYGSSGIGGVAASSSSVSDILNCIAGDYLELWVYSNVAGIVLPVDGRLTYMSVVRVA